MNAREAEEIRLIWRLYEAETSGEFQPAQLLLGPYAAFLTISALQLAWRHPEISPHMRQAIEEIGRGAQTFFGGDTWKLLEAGWDPARDVAGGAR